MSGINLYTYNALCFFSLLQLLQRLRYLLEIVPHQATTLPIIVVLTAVAKMGADHAECIVK
jgi:hypothetical protein